jgi:hypothetical protein
MAKADTSSSPCTTSGATSEVSNKLLVIKTCNTLKTMKWLMSTTATEGCSGFPVKSAHRRKDNCF